MLPLTFEPAILGTGAMLAEKVFQFGLRCDCNGERSL